MKKIIIIFLLGIHISYGQTKKIELVSIENDSIKKTISSLFGTKYDYTSIRNVYWYIQQQKRPRYSEYYLITQGRNYHFLNDFKKKRVYITLVKDKIVFVIIKNDDYLIKRTGFYVDVNCFFDEEFITFEDFSYWVIKADKKTNEAKIIYEKIYEK